MFGTHVLNKYFFNIEYVNNSLSQRNDSLMWVISALQQITRGHTLSGVGGLFLSDHTGRWLSMPLSNLMYLSIKSQTRGRVKTSIALSLPVLGFH